jgi:hypothetical protein
METQKTENTKTLELEFTNSCDDWEWEDALNDVEYFFSGHYYFHFEGWKMGWRNIGGQMLLEIDVKENPADFLRAIASFDTAWIIRIKIQEDHAENLRNGEFPAEFSATVYHHDSPTGEGRKVRAVTWDEYCELYDDGIAENKV